MYLEPKNLLIDYYAISSTVIKICVIFFRVIPEEEREAKYNRHISSTLLSFGYIMEMLQKDDITNISEEFESIFDEKKFWKFSKHHSPMVTHLNVLRRSDISLIAYIYIVSWPRKRCRT